MLREQAGPAPSIFTREEFFAACERYRAAHGEVVSLCRYEAPPGIFWDDQKYRGEAYPRLCDGPFTSRRSPSTPSPTPPKWKSSGPCRKLGRVMHPVLAGGQIEGGIAQGIGYALYEKVVLQNGRMANNQMTNYIMPTAEDVPPIHVFLEEIPFQHGGFGAKGIGELPHDGPAPAILNAIRDATGVGFNAIPLLPEDLFAELRRRAQPVEEPADRMSARHRPRFASPSMAKTAPSPSRP